MIKEQLKINHKPSLVDQVEERLLSYFREMNLEPGDVLPGEIELKEALGVGRSVLREALSRFRMVGLLESKPGTGTILCEPELFNGLERVMNPHLLSREKLMDLLGFRIIIELGAVDFIFENVSESDVSDLETIVDEQVVQENNFFSPQSDFAFHVRLLEIAHNDSVKQFQKIVYPLFEFARENFHEFFSNYQKSKQDVVLVSHRDLLELLKSAAKEKYRQALKMHLDLYFELLKQSHLPL